MEPRRWRWLILLPCVRSSFLYQSSSSCYILQCDFRVIDVDMSAWSFEGLNNDRDDVERDFMNGPQYDDTGDFWEEPDPQWEER